MTSAARQPRMPDDLMERASHALLQTDYFEAEKLCLRALERALRAGDFDLMARITLPLQEARRQQRQEALDAGFRGFFGEMPVAKVPLDAGCYILQPPLVGIDARAFRSLLQRRRVASMVLVKEPTTSTGLWPMVAVGDAQWQPVVVRIRVQAPADPAHPDAAWMLSVEEQLGDLAISKIDPAWPPDHRVEDVMEYLDAVPEHEKLLQLFAATCHEAANAPRSTRPRRRTPLDNPFSF